MKIARLADVKARLVLSRSLRFQSLLEKSRESIRRGKGLSASDFWSAAKKRPGKRAKQVSPVPYPSCSTTRPRGSIGWLRETQTGRTGKQR